MPKLLTISHADLGGRPWPIIEYEYEYVETPAVWSSRGGRTRSATDRRISARYGGRRFDTKIAGAAVRGRPRKATPSANVLIDGGDPGWPLLRGLSS